MMKRRYDRNVLDEHSPQSYDIEDWIVECQSNEIMDERVMKGECIMINDNADCKWNSLINYLTYSLVAGRPLL